MSDEKIAPAERLLSGWNRRGRLLEYCHYETSNHFRRITYMIGIPATVLSAFAGTSVFVSLTSSVSMTFKIVVGTVSVLVAVLTGLQTFLRSDQQSEKHLMAARQYGVLRQQIEHALLLLEQGEKAPVEAICVQMEAQAKESLDIPTKIFERMKAKLAEPEFAPETDGLKAQRQKLAA